MAKQGAKAAVPRLRFLEFGNEPQWETSHLGDICELYQPETIPSSSFTTDGMHLVYGAGGVIGRLDRFNHEHAEVIIGCRGVCGNASLTEPKSWITGNAMVIRSKSDKLSKPFLFHLLDAADLSPVISGSAQPQITRQGLRRFSISAPAPAEQQKIADCLTSLDEVIAAQGRQVEALKAHKRGLMQQLFPREGETRPRLRFPEFRDAPEWMQQRIEAFARDGLTNGIFNDTKRQSSSYRLINVSEMYLPNPICESDLAFAHAGDEDIKKKFAHNGDIFFTRSSLVREGIAYSNIYLGVEKRVTFDGHLIRLRPKLDVVVPIFLHYALKSDVVRSQFIAKSKSATMTTIGQRDVGETGLAIPQLEEQQRIADCLTSLDTRITAETNQLAALKTHKQGLMQQLFPAPEAEAT